MVVYNRTASGGWSSSQTGQSPSSLGYSGARSSSSASSATQATGGQASQNNAIAKEAEKKVDWGHNDRDARAQNAADGMYGESAQKSAQARGYTGSGGSAKSTPSTPTPTPTPSTPTPTPSTPSSTGGNGKTIQTVYEQSGAGGSTYKITGEDGKSYQIAVSGISLEEASKYYADKAARTNNSTEAKEYARIAEDYLNAAGKGNLGREPAQQSGGKEPVVVTKTPYITPGIGKSLSEGNYTVMASSQMVNIPLIEPTHKSAAAQEKADAGDYYGAYKENVIYKRTQSTLPQTINPYADKVTPTESLRTAPIIGNAFTFGQTYFVDAEGKFDPLPLGKPEDVATAYTKRIEGYEEKEGKTGRLEQSVAGAIDIATLPLNFVGGVGTGAAIGIAGKGLAKLTSTKVGTAVANAVTKPWVSKKVVLSTGLGVTKASDRIILTYNKLPKETQNTLEALGKRYASPKAISSLGVGVGANAIGIDSASAVVAKNAVVDTIFKKAALAKPNSKIETAYNIYSAPLLSKGNLRRVDKAVNDAAINTVISVNKFGINHPTAYKAITAAKNAVATPGALAMNTLQGAYLVDAGYRVATSDDKVKTAAQVAVEIPTGFIGAKYGMKAVDKATDYLSTRKLTYIPVEKIGYAEGIPLGKGMNYDTLEKSFDLNTPIPKPYKFGRTEKQNQPTPKAAYLPDEGLPIEKTYPNQVWHATPQGERLGNRIVVGDSTSELPGIYTSEVGVGYYLHLEQKANIKPALLITKSDPSYTPKLANFRVSRVEGIPTKGIEKQSEFLRKQSQGDVAYAPNMKEEYEALLPPGSSFTKFRTRYYTVINGNKVVIDEYIPNSMISAGTRVAKSYGAEDSMVEKVANAGVKKFGLTGGKYKIYKGSSSYGKSSGRQAPLGGTSYAGSIAGKSLSIASSSIKQTPSLSGLFSDISFPSFSKPTSGKGTKSGSTSKGSSTGRGIGSSTPSQPKRPSNPITGGSSKPITYIIESPGKGNKREAPLKRKRDDKRGTDIDFYSAARRGRIEHLSIVDPLEFLGKGSMTNRKRADMTLYKQKIYLVDSSISPTKPTGRRRK